MAYRWLPAPNAQQAYLFEAIWLFFVLLLLVALSRAMFVVPLTWLHNCYAAQRLTATDAVIIW